MAFIDEKIVLEGVTFDDVLLIPAYSEVTPNMVSLSGRFSRNIPLNIPFVSAAMDTVTEADLAIAIAREGGIGVIHKNMSIAAQAAQVRKVKRAESGMIYDPITISKDQTVGEALQLMHDNRIGGIPVVDADNKLIGIVTNRDLRFQTDMNLAIDNVMTKENLVTTSHTDLSSAADILLKNKIEKLPVVDEEGHLLGLITYRDITKVHDYPMACKDSKGRLRVAAGVGVTSDTLDRVKALVEADVDAVVIDTAQGHSANLEETIIKVPHTLNNTNYFDGHVKIDKSEIAFLLPITSLFFKYFTVDELREVMDDGKPMFEMKLLSGESVSVTMRIPIKGAGNVSYIEYTRLYYNNSSADVKNNAGNIAEMKFTGFIMPQVRFNNPEDAIYNISCIQASSSKIEFTFYKGTEKILPKASDCRNEDQQYLTKANNYLLKGENFDYIQVSNHHGYCGILVPIFKQQRNGEQFEFAIDLGTSNTHIEYRMGQNKPQVFGFSKADRQLCEMFTPTKNEYGFFEDLLEETELIERDFLPEEIGSDDYSFPTRTVLSCSKTVDWSKEVNPFNLVNLPFTYDKRADLPYNNLKYNIKWGNGDDLRVMEAYVRCLMLIIRNKVLLNNGDLQHTKITWFYPISMAPKRLRRLKETWDDAYKEYFGDGATTYMTESAAPIQYFFKRYATATSLVNVDIGGGTTDIAFAKDKTIHHVTSFRFASNALFENSFSDLDDNNGIVDWHKGEILKLLEEKNLSELVRVFNSANNHRPSNMASFLFTWRNGAVSIRVRISRLRRVLVSRN